MDLIQSNWLFCLTGRPISRWIGPLHLINCSNWHCYDVTRLHHYMMQHQLKSFICQHSHVILLVWLTKIMQLILLKYITKLDWIEPDGSISLIRNGSWDAKQWQLIVGKRKWWCSVRRRFYSDHEYLGQTSKYSMIVSRYKYRKIFSKIYTSTCALTSGLPLKL